jgi:hypothetical protein
MQFRDSVGRIISEGDYVAFPLGFGNSAPAKVLKLISLLRNPDSPPTALLSIEAIVGAAPNGQLPGLLKIEPPETTPPPD